MAFGILPPWRQVLIAFWRGRVGHRSRSVLAVGRRREGAGALEGVDLAVDRGGGVHRVQRHGGLPKTLVVQPSADHVSSCRPVVPAGSPANTPALIAAM